MKSAIILAIAASLCAGQTKKPQPPKTTRLYSFDCGTIKAMNPTTFGFKEGEVKNRDFVVVCYLIAHPKGTLMWDVGVIPDARLANGPVTEGISTVTKTLKSQMAAIGYSA